MKATDFQIICKKVDIFRFTDFRQYLSKLYALLKEETGEFSYQKLSILLGLGDGNVAYLFIHGKRNPSDKNLKIMTQKIGLKKESRRYFIAMANFQISKLQKDRDKAFEKLLQIKSSVLKGDWDKDTLVFFSEWYYSAIYELLSIDGAKDDPEWLSLVLNPRVSSSKVQQALEHMVDMNLLALSKEKSRLIPTSTNLTTGPLAKGTVFKSYHKEMIRLGTEALINQKARQRDISSVTVSLSEEKLGAIKDLTAKFRKEVLELAQDDRNEKGRRVYQINVQTFPLTQTIRIESNAETQEEKEEES